MIWSGLATVQSSTSTTYKKYQLDLKWSCQIQNWDTLHTKFLLTKYFKSRKNSKTNSVMVVNRPQWVVSDLSVSQKLSGLHPKPRF